VDRYFILAIILHSILVTVAWWAETCSHFRDTRIQFP